jgi:hypothetical protein
MGAGTSRGRCGFVFDRLVLPLLPSRAYKVKDGLEAAIVLLW